MDNKTIQRIESVYVSCHLQSKLESFTIQGIARQVCIRHSRGNGISQALNSCKALLPVKQRQIMKKTVLMDKSHTELWDLHIGCHVSLLRNSFLYQHLSTRWLPNVNLQPSLLYQVPDHMFTETPQNHHASNWIHLQFSQTYLSFCISYFSWLYWKPFSFLSYSFIPSKVLFVVGSGNTTVHTAMSLSSLILLSTSEIDIASVCACVCVNGKCYEKNRAK